MLGTFPHSALLASSGILGIPLYIAKMAMQSMLSRYLEAGMFLTVLNNFVMVLPMSGIVSQREQIRVMNIYALCEFLSHRRARLPSQPSVTEACPTAG